MALTKVTGEFIDISDLDLSDVGTISLDAIQGDADANTSITFSGSDVITIATGGSGRLTIGDGALSPVTDNQIDLGTASLEFKDAFFDGTVTADAFAGPLTGNVTGNASGTALTVTQAAQSAITSVGTLTGLTGGTGDFIWDTNSLVVDSSANKVGIGTTTPTYLLDVESTSAWGAIFELNQKSDGTEGAQLFLKHESASAADNDYIGFLHFKGMNDAGTPEEVQYARIYATTADVTDGNEDGSLFFDTAVAGTANSSVMALVGGKVGIGTATPGYPLHVAGSTIGLFNTGADAIFYLGEGEGGGAYAKIYWKASDDTLRLGTQTGGDTITITEAGNVGIGTTSPNANVSMTISSDGSGSVLTGIKLIDSNSGDDYQIYTNAGNFYVRNATDGRSDIAINGAGLVGIGTGSPSADLHIYATADDRPHLLLEGYKNHGTNDAPIIEIYTNDQTTGGIADDTSVGIIRFSGDEKDSGAKEVYAEIKAIAHDPGSGSSNKGKLQFRTQSAGDISGTMTIDESSVGINNDDPAVALHVKQSGSAMIRVDCGGGTSDSGFEIYQNGTRKWEIVNDDSESDPLDIRTSGGAGGSGIRIAQNGKVGIAVGNIPPAEMLHMIAASGDANIRMEGDAVRLKKSGSDWLSYDGTNLKLSVGNNEAMRIDSTRSATFKTSTTAGQTHVYYSSGAVTLADDATLTLTGIANTGALISIGSNKNSANGTAYMHALFFAQYGVGLTGVTEVADPANQFAAADTDGSVCCYKSAGTGTVTVKNRLGHSTNISVTVHRYQGN